MRWLLERPHGRASTQHIRSIPTTIDSASASAFVVTPSPISKFVGKEDVYEEGYASGGLGYERPLGGGGWLMAMQG
jgi:hypothetical protein